jgi:hypothetical protein
MAIVGGLRSAASRQAQQKGSKNCKAHYPPVACGAVYKFDCRTIRFNRLVINTAFEHETCSPVILWINKTPSFRACLPTAGRESPFDSSAPPASSIPGATGLGSDQASKLTIVDKQILHDYIFKQ